MMIDFDLDITIFVTFLVGTIVVGLYSSRGTYTITQYAVGDRNFSTATLVATIVATWISGEFFYSSITEAYKNGLYSIWIALGDPLYLLCIGLFFAPRMGEFLGNLSIAEAMGDLYGKHVRILTALAGTIGSAGCIAIQLKLAGSIFEYALGISSIQGIIIATFIVTLYSSLGGIKSVTFTDVIQFFTFGVFIPVAAYALMTSIDGVDIVTKTITTSPLFDYKEVFDFSNPLAIKQLFLFLLFIVPGFGPAIFQRIAIARDTTQVRNSFIIAAITCLLFGAIINWIAVLTLSIDSSIDPAEVVKHVIFNSPLIGMKGALLAGVMAMIMSTVDSFINSTAVLIVHDFCKPLKIKFIRNEIFSARIASLLIGALSLILSLKEASLLELLVITESFYLPIVSPPFIMAILGFRTSSKSVILSMIAGLGTVLIWDYILEIESVNSVCFGMLANLLVLMSSHYLLKQSGGWVGIKDMTPLINARAERKLKYQKLISDVKSFNLLNILVKNTPKGDGLISFLGLFVMISGFASTYTLTKVHEFQYAHIVNFIYPAMLCSASALTSYPLWLPMWRKTKAIGIVWNLIMIVGLICFSFLMVLISDFAEIQLMVFMINILIISSFTSWRWALFTITTGIIITTFCYQTYINIETTKASSTSQFQIIYLLLMVSSTLIIFLKPKQEYVEATEHKVGELEITINDLDNTVVHYSQRVADQAVEIERLGATAQKILNNVNHELRLPVGNVMNFAEMLAGGLETYSKAQLKILSKEVLTNSNRLSTMILNMLDLSMLCASKIELQKKTVNLSELVEDRINNCCKIYLQGKKIDFQTSIEPDILIAVDPNYIRQTVDNLIINAITYSQKGTIKVSLLCKGSNIVEFAIKDEGIGIQKEELFDIFTPFKMGIKTESKAEGRGVGLALCKAAIEAHDGKIKVESGGNIGAKFTFILSLK